MRRCHFNPPDFNPPAPCGAGPLPWANGIAPARFQSTRPMRGGTAWLPVVSEHRGHFNPPAPCGAGLWPKDWGKGLAIFQSTRPMRGGTRQVIRNVQRIHISIHPPHAGRDFPGRESANPIRISIHPPHAGRDSFRQLLSLRSKISIHPPHAGRDDGSGGRGKIGGHFNPPAPCGAGPLQSVRPGHI